MIQITQGGFDQKVQDVALKVQDVALKVQDVIPKVQDGARKVQDGAQKVQNGTQKVQEDSIQEIREGIGQEVLKTRVRMEGKIKSLFCLGGLLNHLNQNIKIIAENLGIKR